MSVQNNQRDQKENERLFNKAIKLGILTTDSTKPNYAGNFYLDATVRHHARFQCYNEADFIIVSLALLK
jgi:hypothetical protein